MAKRANKKQKAAPTRDQLVADYYRESAEAGDMALQIRGLRARLNNKYANMQHLLRLINVKPEEVAKAEETAQAAEADVGEDSSVEMGTDDSGAERA